ncbi:MAG: 5-(carboxyamino)imidazole ribonucleotide synthase [Methylococcaceae bacterium]|jgi:5-(carboxyamino)imidazole ribonucleotide synthase
MRVGILGGGQLARMLALAGYPLGLEFIVLDPGTEACAAKLSPQLKGDYTDQHLLASLAEQADVVTYEFENVPAEVAAFLSARTQVYPPPKALAVAQDRLLEKNFFNELNIPTPTYADITSLQQLSQVMTDIGWPAILKSRRMGYDGKGQSLLNSTEDLAPAWQLLNGAPAIVEAFVPFQREVSIIAARSVSGETAFYPLSQNQHSKGILRVAESCPNDAQQAQAEAYALRLLENLDYVGVLALELFVVNGQLIANEFAPRVHNSGHWTIEGAQTSQFENHLRAILDLPLGSTQLIGHAAMVNFIGNNPSAQDVLKLPQTHLHLYDKAARPGRKVAHATVRCDDQTQLQGLVDVLAALAERLDDS